MTGIDAQTVRIDSHAHVFKRGLPLAPGHRHAPRTDALLPELLRVFDRHGITHGVLTAPSFYGADNSFLLMALDAAPARLRGTVIVDPTVTRAALEEMGGLGVVGMRLNLLRRSNLPDFRAAPWRHLFETVAALDWHIEIYVEGPRLAALLPTICECVAKVVVDHFGSPDPEQRLNCLGFRMVLDAVQGGRTWVKLSAPYRLGGVDPKPYAEALLRAAGPQRLVWASDWPWTQYSDGMTYAKTLAWLSDWVPDPA